MRFRIARTGNCIDAPAPVEHDTLETIPPQESDSIWSDGPEYYVTINTLEELIALDHAAGDHGLILHFVPTDRGWYRDKQPHITIYDGYNE